MTWGPTHIPLFGEHNENCKGCHFFRLCHEMPPSKTTKNERFFFQPLGVLFETTQNGTKKETLCIYTYLHIYIYICIYIYMNIPCFFAPKKNMTCAFHVQYISPPFQPPIFHPTAPHPPTSVVLLPPRRAAWLPWRSRGAVQRCCCWALCSSAPSR